MLLLLLALQQQPLAARADTLKPAQDAVDYDITLVLPDTGNHLLGQVQTRWHLTSTKPIEVQLDTSMRVVRVLMDGTADARLARSLYGRDQLTVVIPQDRAPGDSMTTAIRYHGYPRAGLVFGKDPQGGMAAFADNWPDHAHYWLPVQDVPSDKATASFHVEVPEGYQVIANGTLQRVDTLPRGRTVWHYRIAEPIPVYTMVVGVARFAVTSLPDAACAVRCVPMALWTFPGDSAWAGQGPFRRAGDIVDYFSQLVGPFPYERLSHVQSATRFGGMENSTAIFYPEQAYLDRKLDEGTVAHETAHQWFGDAVTERDWHHVWLSEGFATYFAALWQGHAYGDSAFRRVMAKEADDATINNPVADRPILDFATRNLDSLLNANTYPKGAYVLHTLRGLMGDSLFFSGIREYYRRFRDSTALSSDFADVMNETSGTDYNWYFEQALTQPGFPVLVVRWRYSSGELKVQVQQVQKDSWGVFQIPGLVLRAGGVDYHLDIADRLTQHTFTGVKNRPDDLVVDPDGWWLISSEVREVEGRRR